MGSHWKLLDEFHPVLTFLVKCLVILRSNKHINIRFCLYECMCVCVGNKKLKVFCLSMFQVVELLLSKGANKEHRNVSDYTPLSLAASGGFVNIIKLLLSHGAEINSRYCIYRTYSFFQSNIEIIAELIELETKRPRVRASPASLHCGP